MPDRVFDHLLITKLQPPPGRERRVARPRLLDALDEGARRRLTLISAPAGYGKSTLLTGWLERSPLAVAWLSLDEGDNDLRRFLAYLVAALQWADETLNDVEIPTENPEAVLATVLNDLAHNPADLALVLDDFHLVTNPALHDLLARLLERAPPQFHLVVSTRSDPPLPLSRWRARGQLCELRAAELRFSSEEVRAFLDEVMGLELSGRDRDELARRTEGWAAGLQLAALSLQGRAQVSDFIERFTGTDRFVLDYLTEEVLVRQPGEVQNFLLLSSVLPRLSGPLCDAVTGQASGQARLEALERANLFIAPLDSERRWYRYHAFFADLLRHRLERERPDLVPELHARASRWFGAEGLQADALHHALLAGDYRHAAALVETGGRSQAVRDAVGSVLPAADPAQPLAALLEAATQHGPELQSRLLAAFEDGPETRIRDVAQAGALEPLSDRELEVLRLVAAGLSNKEIARRLDISLNTVKTHGKNIYGKLAVASRTQAVARAQELGLL